LSLAFITGTNFLASGSADMSIKIWDITSGSLKYTFDRTNQGHTMPVNVLTSANMLLASGSDDDKVKIWNKF
jgi:WD40 repeat protein